MTLDLELVTDLNETYRATPKDYATIMPGDNEDCSIDGNTIGLFNETTKKFKF